MSDDGEHGQRGGEHGTSRDGQGGSEHGGGHGDGGHGGGEHGGGHGDGEHGGGHGGEHGKNPVGEIAGGVGTVLEGVGELLGDGEDTAEAREALETATEVAEGVGKGAEMVDDLMEVGKAINKGDVGKIAGGLGDALGNAGAGVGALTGAIGGMVPEEVRQGFQEAQRVANSVGQIAQGVGQVVKGAAELLDQVLGGRHPVHFELEIAGQDTRFSVRNVHLHESLSDLYSGAVSATFGKDESLDEHDLLSKDVSLTIERGEERRHFRGIIRHASIHRAPEHHVLHLDIAPALWLADETLDSRIYQDKTVPDLVEEVVQELLGSRHRTVKRELTQEYDPHEYLVQHRESHFAFLSRLMREEGIFFYFDHDEDDQDHEVLVLADSNSNRPLVRPNHDGVVEYEEEENRREGREVAFYVHRYQRVGATDAVVRGYDWTNPALNVQHERTERANWNGPRLEVYDHHHAVRHHGYDDGGGSYQSHTADRQSRHRAERLDLARSRWTVSTTVVTAQPGHVFELQGADTHDDRYLIVSMSSSGEAEEHGGSYTNTLEVIPTSVPYRPPAPERQPMPGPETAIVVGPEGEEIHTDRHGRIKVQFHWDRQGQRNEHSSAWIRVAQSWAGPGWGFVFIPRIGMEVIVQFLGGDPDRPIVTGCVYNGTNTPPYPLPDEKTKSTIKTNSSLGGGDHGSNELRFEDKKGSEEIYIHAEKDFNEVVEHNHSTHVKNDQTNTVDHDQTETVKNDQKLTVKNNRTKTVEGDETVTIGTKSGNRTETVHGNEEVTIHKNRKHTIMVDDVHTVSGKHSVSVINGELINILNGQQLSVVGDRKTTVVTNDILTIAGQNNISVGQHWTTVCNASQIFLDSTSFFAKAPTVVQLQAGDGQSRLELHNSGQTVLSTSSRIALECGSAKIELNSDGSILIEGTSVQVKGGESFTKLEASGATMKGPKTDVLADMFCTIKGTLVRIN